MVLECISSRRSTRKFKPTPVTKEQVSILLTAAMLSPSACNTRPWRFVVISNRALLDSLAEAHSHAKMLTTAQLAIVVVALPAAQEDVMDGVPKGFYPQDCAAATQNILLQAEAIGLGSCWCGVYPRKEVIDAIAPLVGTSPGEVPFCIIALGEKDQFPNPRGKYEEEKVSWVE